MEENTQRARVHGDQGDHCAHLHVWAGLFSKVSGQKACPIGGMLSHRMLGVGTRYWGASTRYWGAST